MTVTGLRLMHWPDPLTIDLPELPSELDRAKALIDRRRARTAVFGDFADLFYDPVWDMLLQLFVAHEEGTGLTLNALCSDTRLSPMVRRRWILAMEQRLLVNCWPMTDGADCDTDDRHVGLTAQAVTMLLNYLDGV